MYSGPRDIKIWVDLSNASENHRIITRRTFGMEFGSDPDSLYHRMTFLYMGGRPIGTYTAWYDELYHRPELGRIRWISILPEYDRGALAEAFAANALYRLVALGHSSAYATIDAWQTRLIEFLLALDFQPWLQTERDPEAWCHVARSLA